MSAKPYYSETVFTKPIEGEQKVSWRSPSNIALIKYWGKKGVQIPANPSLSMTLQNCYTETTLYFTFKKSPGIACEVYFNDERNTSFEEKIITFLENIVDFFPFLPQINIRIETRNTFPHAAGIASSASGLSAIALCLCSIEKDYLKALPGDLFFRKASFIARLGSGSASRSVWGGYSVWGYHEKVEGSENEIAIPLDLELHGSFHNMQDTVLIVDSTEKEVSSRVGHSLMNHHPFAEARYKQAQSNITKILKSMQQGDVEGFISIVENEALTLHGLMISSVPQVMLFAPNTIAILKKIRSYRKQTGRFICFTLDAGPNVHLIYPAQEKSEIDHFISNDLSGLFVSRIDDMIGEGPVELK